MDNNLLMIRKAQCGTGHSVHSGRTPMERRVSNGGRVCRDMGIRASGRACHARMLRLLRLPPGTSAHIATGVQTYSPSSAGGQGL